MIKGGIISFLLLVLTVSGSTFFLEPQVIKGVMVDDMGGDKIVIWNRTIRTNISLKNSGDLPITSDRNEIESEVHSVLRIYIENEKESIVFDENYDFKDTALDDEENNTPVEFTIPESVKEGVLIIEVKCRTAIKVRRCNSEIKKLKHTFSIRDASVLKIIGIDVTKTDDKAELGILRQDLTYNFGIVDTTSIYKTIPAGIEFPAFHKDVRESWGGIILLYNVAQGHQKLSETTKKIQSILQDRYHLPVILKEYDKENFQSYTYRFSDCYPQNGKNNCIFGKFDFDNLNSGIEGNENLFTYRIFEANSKLDFIFLLPYDNQ